MDILEWSWWQTEEKYGSETSADIGRKRGFGRKKKVEVLEEGIRKMVGNKNVTGYAEMGMGGWGSNQ